MIDSIITNMQFTNFDVGFEIEAENYDIYIGAHKLNLEKLFGEFGTIKPDGSLKHGFEIASKIYKSNDFLSTSDLSKWNDLYSRLDEVGAADAENTGMHIHVSREYLTTDEILKINYFVFSSQSLMDTVGGRTANNWCYFYRNTPKQVEEKNGPKYCYLNCGHQNTIEFRFFRTPMMVDGFLRNMQFVCAIIEFVKRSEENSAYFRDKAPRNLVQFLDFVSENKDVYNNLYKFIALDSNQKRLEKGEIRVEKAINCDLYPTQKIKRKISRLLMRHNGNSNGVTIQQLDNLIGQVNPEKAAKTYEYLGRVFARANRRSVEKIYFNELPSPFEQPIPAAPAPAPQVDIAWNEGPEPESDDEP